MTISKTSRAITRRVFTPKRDEALAALTASYEAQQAEHREYANAFWFGPKRALHVSSPILQES